MAQRARGGRIAAGGAGDKAGLGVVKYAYRDLSGTVTVGKLRDCTRGL